MSQIPTPAQELPSDLSNEWASPEVFTDSDVQVARARMASLGLTAMEPFFGASPQQSTLLAQQIWALHQAKKTSPATPSKVPRPIPPYKPSGMPAAQPESSASPDGTPASLKDSPTTSPSRLPIPSNKLRGVKSYATFQRP
ncbi:hypothetical protein IE81DRAFT_345417 [Ceraceosorus guamensis]|uniref:Uncharacterized protein n=1 Tax=Ceraceosorus guamensis TaxID=1522189 RepID=A0A316W4D8_9BASI|nr:hypothetical protein IE81DRAFT_345417 [Ceraceosorus guamensis]PWN44720.1 hypothetical protein IE81DRAFT_345417 [Ceraceosorus guamensis]